MYDKEGDANGGVLRRKSARIFALEEKEKEKRKSRAAISHNHQKGKANFSDNVQPFQDQQMKRRGASCQQSSLKRSRKQKRLEDINVPYFGKNRSLEDGEGSKDGNHSTRTDQQPNELAPMPPRHTADYALAVLQRRDINDIFAQPVDPDMVEDYYTIIKEPMDFGSVKNKLQEGKYTSLEQFEGEVFLIFNNAMLFNEPTSVYYTEAHAMQILAKGIFSVLRTNPYDIESEFPLTKGRITKKPSGKTKIKGRLSRTPRSIGVKIGTSSCGPTDNGDSTFPKREDPQFSRPWTSFLGETETLVSSVYNAEKTLEVNEKGLAGYKQSLLWFGKGLGSVAKGETLKKLLKCLPTRAIVPSQNSERLPPRPSFGQSLVSQNDQSPITPLQNSPGSSNFLHGRNTLNGNPATYTESNKIGELRNLRLPPKAPTNQTRRNELLGKSPMLDNNMASITTFGKFKHNHSLGKMPMVDYIPFETTSSQPKHSLAPGNIPMFLNNSAQNTTNFNIFGCSSRDIGAYPSANRTKDLRGNTYLTQNPFPQQELKTQNGRFWLASHLKVSPVEDPNNPYGKKFVTMDLLAEPEDPIGNQQGQESDYDMSANWKSRLGGFVNRGNNFLNSFDLFASPIEPPTRVQSSGSYAAQGMVIGESTNSNNYANIYKLMGPSRDGYVNSDELATLKMLLTNEYTPLPSYDEVGDMLLEAGNGGRVGTESTDEGPSLSLQL